MDTKARSPKETDEIKELLDAYEELLKKIDLKEKRCAFLEDSLDSLSSSNLSGMSGGGSYDRTSRQERNYIQKEELKEQLDALYVEENQRREEITAMVELMKKPKEQTLIEMHYLDGFGWPAISATLHGEEPDYDENEERYLKRTFKIHGHALQSLARIYKKIQGKR